jgi:hypothetical protein
MVRAAADAGITLRRLRPFKEGAGRARSAHFITEVQMVTAWIVEVHRLFDQMLALHLRVEINRALRVVADQRDVIQP